MQERKCPFYQNEDTWKIYCDGITTDSMLCTFYKTKLSKKNHSDFYCEGYYFACPNAVMLNQKLQKYKISVCKYNVGVDCIDTTNCKCCGWNPVVARERLRKY